VWFLLGDLFSRRVAATYKGLTLCFGSLCVCSLLPVQVVQVTSGLAGPARAQPSQQRPPQDHPAEATHPSRSLARGAPAGTWEALTTRRHPLGRSTAYVAHTFAATAMRSIEAGDIHSHSAERARCGWLRRRMVVGGSHSAVPPGAVTVTVTVLGAVVLPIRLSIGRLTSRCEPPLPPPPPSA
jgi:hypothetical protein